MKFYYVSLKKEEHNASETEFLTTDCTKPERVGIQIGTEKHGNYLELN